jgi:hypothetical protein
MNKMNVQKCIFIFVVLILVSCSTYTTTVITDIPQDDISLKVIDVNFAYISPKGAIEKIAVKITNNTNESLFLDWTKSVIQDNKGTHRILPNRSATELIFLQMPPMLIPSNGFIQNWIYSMNDTDYDYNSQVLILTLCYRLNSTSDEKFARFIIESEKK